MPDVRLCFTDAAVGAGAASLDQQLHLQTGLLLCLLLVVGIGRDFDLDAGGPRRGLGRAGQPFDEPLDLANVWNRARSRLDGT